MEISYWNYSLCISAATRAGLLRTFPDPSAMAARRGSITLLAELCFVVEYWYLPAIANLALLLKCVCMGQRRVWRNAVFRKFVRFNGLDLWRLLRLPAVWPALCVWCSSLLTLFRIYTKAGRWWDSRQSTQSLGQADRVLSLTTFNLWPRNFAVLRTDPWQSRIAFKPFPSCTHRNYDNTLAENYG